MTIQPFGRILMGGYRWSGNDFDFPWVRYQANRARMTEFGIEGKVTTAIGTRRDIEKNLVLQPDGKILLGDSNFHGVDDDCA